MKGIDCDFWAQGNSAHGYCGAGVYLRPTPKLCEYCLANDMRGKRAGKVAAQLPPSGPGTELKKLFGSMGIFPFSNCSCEARAMLMDRNGPDWCEENIETIVGWLSEEANKRHDLRNFSFGRRAAAALVRHVPYKKFAARRLVRLAIRNARKRPPLGVNKINKFNTKKMHEH